MGERERLRVEGITVKRWQTVQQGKLRDKKTEWKSDMFQAVAVHGASQ